MFQFELEFELDASELCHPVKQLEIKRAFKISLFQHAAQRRYDAYVPRIRGLLV
jgi:hypothetical protein